VLPLSNSRYALFIVLRFASERRGAPRAGWTDPITACVMLGMRPKHVVSSLLVLVLVAVAWLWSRHPRSVPVPPSGTAPAVSPSAEVRKNGRDVAVPQSCTPEVNQKLAALVAQQQSRNVDNVMVCGMTIAPSQTQRGGRHGAHEVLPLLVSLPGAGSKLVEVVINDELDGVVTAPKDAQVFAYGQAFFPTRGRFVAGIHDVHCATHRTADNGWVVVDGRKSPASCPAYEDR
jgi:hypothetical protein